MNLITINGFAQDKKLVDIKNLSAIKPGTRITDSSSANYLGTWKSQSENGEVILVLSKIISPIGSGANHVEIEMLNGGYKYTEQGKEIFNTLTSKPLYGTTSGMNNTISFSITDTSTGKETLFIGKLTDKNTMSFKLSNKRGEGIHPDKNLSFLYDLKLTRQK